MKRRIFIYVDAEVLEAFKRVLLKKHGKVWRVMGEEITSLMREWLQRNGEGVHTQNAHVSCTFSSSRTGRVWEDVKNYLRQRYGYSLFFPGQKIPRKHIVSAISEVRGNDSRTVRKWVKRFIEEGVLRWNGGEVFEVA